MEKTVGICESWDKLPTSTFESFLKLSDFRRFKKIDWKEEQLESELWWSFWKGISCFKGSMFRFRANLRRLIHPRRLTVRTRKMIGLNFQSFWLWTYFQGLLLLNFRSARASYQRNGTPHFLTKAACRGEAVLFVPPEKPEAKTLEWDRIPTDPP